MTNLQRSRLSLWIAAALIPGSHLYASELMLDGYHIPEGFETAFANRDLDVEVMLGKQVIGSATLHIEDDALLLKNISSLDLSAVKSEYQAVLNQLLEAKILRSGVVCSAELSQEAQCQSGQKVLSLDYDPSTLQATIFVNANWLNDKKQQEVQRDKLGKSSFSAPSAILQQNLNFSSEDSINYNAQTNFSLGEQQFYLSGSAYRNYGRAETKLESAYWLHDFEGEYLSVGYRSSWDNSTYMGATSAFFPRKDLLGVSYGTSRRTLSTTAEESDVPVNVFMPTTGKVEVYREGRLINTQLLEAGLQKLDTHEFPYGVYDVEVKIFSGNKLIDTQSHTVYKKTDGTGKLEYNFWVGSTQDRDFYGVSDKNQNGLSVGATARLPLTASLDLEGGAYHLEDTSAVELGVRKLFTSGVDLQANLIGTQHGSNGLDSRVSFDLLGLRNSISYLWFDAKEEVDRRNYRSDSNRLSYSGYFSLPYGQSLSANLERDWQQEASRASLRYSKFFNMGSSDTLQLELSLSQDWQKEADTDNVAFLSLSYSFGANDMNTTLRGSGYNNGDYLGEVSSDYQISGSDILRSVNGRVSRSKQDTSAYVGARFDSRVLGGHISGQYHNYDKGSEKSNLFGSLQSTVGGNVHGIAMSGQNSQAGLIINTNQTGDDNLVAVANGQRFVMKEGHNFVPLSAYQNNTVYFDVKGREDQTFKFDNNSYGFTAYPGNVGYKKVEVTQAVEVVGQLRNPQGEVIPQTIMTNHIGNAVTDINGMFSAVISREHPTLHIEEGQYLCDFDLSDQIAEQGDKGFVFVGDMVCAMPTNLVNTRGKNEKSSS